MYITLSITILFHLLHYIIINLLFHTRQVRLPTQNIKPRKISLNFPVDLTSIQYYVYRF